MRAERKPPPPPPPEQVTLTMTLEEAKNLAFVASRNLLVDEFKELHRALLFEAEVNY